MSDNFPPPDVPDQSAFPQAKVRRRYFSAIWLLPIIAALVAGYLGLRSYAERGPEITVTFLSGEGLSAGQTPVKYKAVTIGTVQNIGLSKDRNHVIVHIRMMATADPMLTENARFWVVRPRLNSPNFSALETLVSGTYIQIDPGDTDADKRTSFTGLEVPPNITSDEPGTTYVLKADRIGSISAGTPVFYRDINVGEVLGCDIGDGFGPVTINILIRTPYDAFVKPSSRFWNTSGFFIKMGDGGLHVELQSLQSVFQGGIAFSTPSEAKNTQQVAEKTVFQLYENHAAAENVDLAKPVEYVTYFQDAIKDLAAGSPVRIFGIRVGVVKEVKLVFDAQKPEAKVRVVFDVQPDKAFGISDPNADSDQIARQLVQNGMRVRIESSDLIIGQEILSLEFAPGAGKADVVMEGDALVLPGQGGGLDHLADAVGDIAGKLKQIPFDQIGEHLNHLSAVADQTLAGPEMQKAFHSLAVTMTNLEDLTNKADTDLTPALQKLPEISTQLQDAVTHANEFMASVNSGYGKDSEFQRNAQRVLNEVNDAARSIRLLADFLERHPEAIIQGKSGEDKTDGRSKP